jgi:hypothetical protein
VKVEVTGQFRSGIAQKSQKQYFMCEAFAHLPGVPYPQKFSFYAAAQNEIPQVGTYECDVMASIKDDRINFEVDPRQGRRVSAVQQPQVKAAG